MCRSPDIIFNFVGTNVRMYSCMVVCMNALVYGGVSWIGPHIYGCFVCIDRDTMRHMWEYKLSHGGRPANSHTCHLCITQNYFSITYCL